MVAHSETLCILQTIVLSQAIKHKGNKGAPFRAEMPVQDNA